MSVVGSLAIDQATRERLESVKLDCKDLARFLGHCLVDQVLNVAESQSRMLERVSWFADVSRSTEHASSRSCSVLALSHNITNNNRRLFFFFTMKMRTRSRTYVSMCK